LERESLEDQEIDAAAKGIGFLWMTSGHDSPLEVEKSIRSSSLEVKRRTRVEGRGSRVERKM
jgi:hypothetical protein